MRQLVLDLLPAPAPSFDNFVAGRNAEALSAIRHWLAAPAPATTCVLLWGEARCGRSHLLRAAHADHPGALAIDAQADPALRELEDLPASVDLLLADNVDQLDGDGQIHLFNAFNRLKMRGGGLLAASSQPPAALRVREDLRTRLGSGLVYRLTALSDAEKVTALDERARRLGLKLPSGALDYLLGHAPRDMASLTAIVDALDRFTLEHKRPVTLPLLRSLIHEGGATAAATPHDLASCTCTRTH